jgi:hypothetical protein
LPKLVKHSVELSASCLGTVGLADFDPGGKILIFESIWTNFIASDVFRGRWGSNKNWLKLKIQPSYPNLVCLN